MRVLAKDQGARTDKLVREMERRGYVLSDVRPDHASETYHATTSEVLRQGRGKVRRALWRGMVALVKLASWLVIVPAMVWWISSLF
jgi:hypothetical protein